MNVNLGPTLDRFVEDLVKTGLYQSNSEVVREGLRLLKEREQLRQFRLAELKKDVKLGLDDEARGDVAPWDPAEIKKEGRKLLAKRKGR